MLIGSVAVHEPNSPGSMVSALEKLVTDENLRCTMGQAGLKRVQKNFDVPHIIQQLEKVYEETIR